MAFHQLPKLSINSLFGKNLIEAELIIMNNSVYYSEDSPYPITELHVVAKDGRMLGGSTYVQRGSVQLHVHTNQGLITGITDCIPLK